MWEIPVVIRVRRGKAVAVTADHTLVKEQRRLGTHLRSGRGALRDPSRSDPRSRARAYVVTDTTDHPVKQGDLLVLCSDGVIRRYVRRRHCSHRLPEQRHSGDRRRTGERMPSKSMAPTTPQLRSFPYARLKPWRCIGDAPIASQESDSCTSDGARKRHGPGPCRFLMRRIRVLNF